MSNVLHVRPSLAVWAALLLLTLFGPSLILTGIFGSCRQH